MASSPTWLMAFKATPTAFTNADDEESPDATGTVDDITPSKPWKMAWRRASSWAGAFT